MLNNPRGAQANTAANTIHVSQDHNKQIPVSCTC